MSNTLATVLDQDSGRALVEKYIEKKFLERESYDTSLAASEYADEFTIPNNNGVYVEATRKNHVRLPENVSLSNETADPASGITLAVTKVKLPLEYIHEYAGIGTIAQDVTWIDLESWVNEDMPIALKRRLHQLTQNAFKAGRYLPGVRNSSGVATTAFDTTVEKSSVSAYGLTFNFDAAVAAFVDGKSAFSALQEGDRCKMSDIMGAKAALANSQAPKISGRYICHLSEAMAIDLMDDDKYFRAAVQAFKGEGIKEGTLTDYMGVRFVIDDEPFTENFGAALVRASGGPIHTAIMHGGHAFAYVRLGKKGSRVKPTFKVQDITKTGKEKTIGYTIPFQVGIIKQAWARTITGPVGHPDVNA